MHKESWIAWLGYGALALLIFAVFWFYAVFHLLLRIPLVALLEPFVVLVIIVELFAIAGKISRERMMNRGRLTPMVISIGLMFLVSMWCFAFYGARLGFLSRDDLMFVYFGSPVIMVACGLGTYYVGQQAIGRDWLSKIRRAGDPGKHSE